MLYNLNTAEGMVGLYLNLKKTKVIFNTKMINFDIRGENIEVVDHFSLLGSIIEADCSCKKELSKRLALGRAAMTGLSEIWKDKDLKIAVKCRSVKALIFRGQLRVQNMDDQQNTQREDQCL